MQSGFIQECRESLFRFLVFVREQFGSGNAGISVSQQIQAFKQDFGTDHDLVEQWLFYKVLPWILDTGVDPVIVEHIIRKLFDEPFDESKKALFLLSCPSWRTSLFIV